MSASLVPVFTTNGGSSLTAENWLELGINTLSCHLSSLLAKPGYNVLTSFPDLKTYLGWQGQLILNAANLKFNSEGACILRSPYDGSRLQYTWHEIMELIVHLNPEMIILPEALEIESSLKSLPETIFPFLPLKAINIHTSKRAVGAAFSYEENTKMPNFTEIPLYLQFLSGSMDFSWLKEWLACDVQYIESDLPAADACEGRIYSGEGVLVLSESQYALQFETLDKHCGCPTCSQQLTRAYLHHLLSHTPLLCQRFLIQHNVYYWQSMMNDAKLTLSTFTPP